jgi:hypothetical protein
VRNVVRWFLFVPAALAASLATGLAASWLGELFGGSPWYIWLISGAASAWGFFYVAFRIAPAGAPIARWVSVAVVGVLGLLAALGPLLSGRNRISALAGATMLGFAIYYARLPYDAVRADLQNTIGDDSRGAA